jgi:alpha-tubulin suppressor-like RCC1 family protein
MAHVSQTPANVSTKRGPDDLQVDGWRINERRWPLRRITSSTHLKQFLALLRRMLDLTPNTVTRLLPHVRKLGVASGQFRVISLGRNDAVMIRRDGTLAAWGTHESVTNVLAGTFLDVGVAAVHAVAIADDHSIVRWGSDSYTYPDGLTTVTGLLNLPRGGTFKALDAAVLYSLALHDDGTVYAWGHESNGSKIFDNLEGNPWITDPARSGHPVHPG